MAAAKPTLPADAIEVVPSLFVSSSRAVPTLISHFNIAHVACLSERAPDADALRCGGTEAHPYGRHIRHIHVPLRDAPDERGFAAAAQTVAEWIHGVIGGAEAEAEMLKAEEEAAAAETEQGSDEVGEPASTTPEPRAESKSEAIEEQRQLGSASTPPPQVASEQAGVEASPAIEGDGVCANCGGVQGDAAVDDEDDAPWGSAPLSGGPAGKKGHGAVLVHCDAGQSRSVAVVCAYLMLHRGMSLDDALAQFRRDDDDETSGSDSGTEKVAKADSVYTTRVNPTFLQELARVEELVHGERLFNLASYLEAQLAALFPTVPRAVVRETLRQASGNVFAAREALMRRAVQSGFSRDALMVEALHSMAVQTVADWRPRLEGGPRCTLPTESIITLAECRSVYEACDRKRDVALLEITKRIRERINSALVFDA